MDGHEAEVHVAAMQQLGAARGDVEPHVEPLGVAVEPVHERTRVQILDRAEADPAHPPIRR